MRDVDAVTAAVDNNVNDQIETPLSLTSDASKAFGVPIEVSVSSSSAANRLVTMSQSPSASNSTSNSKNKFGYQRISVACGNCRKRKVRCLIEDGDPQSRCQNCLRLGEECVFYPASTNAPSNDTDVGTGQTEPQKVGSTKRSMEQKQAAPLLPDSGWVDEESMSDTLATLGHGSEARNPRLLDVDDLLRQWTTLAI